MANIRHYLIGHPDLVRGPAIIQQPLLWLVFFVLHLIKDLQVNYILHARSNRTTIGALLVALFGCFWLLHPNPAYAGYLQSTIHGKLYANETGSAIDCSGAGNARTVAVSTDAAAPVTGDCTAADGSYSFNVPVSNTGVSVLTIFLDGETEDAVVVTKITTYSSDFFDLDLYQNRVIIRHEDAGPLTNNNLDQYDNSQDSDIPFTVTNWNLTVNSGTELHVWTGKNYDPQGLIVTNATGGDFHIDDGATAEIDTPATVIGGDIRVDAGATLNVNDSFTISGGDIATIGTGTITSAATPTVTLTGTGTIGGGSGAITFYNFIRSGSGTSTVGTNLTVENDLTVSAGVLDLVTYNLSVGGGDIAVNGTLFQDTTGTTTVTTTGAISGSGSTTFGNLTIGTSSSTMTTTATTDFTVRTVLRVITSSGTNTFNAGTRTITLSGSGTPLVIDSTEVFTSSTSTFVYTNATSATIANVTYYHLTTNGAGTFSFQSGVTDDFQRAGPGLGGNWTTREGAPVIHNASDFGGNNVSGNTATYSAQTFYNDQYAEAVVSGSFTGGSEVHLCVRLSNSGGLNGYCYVSDGVSFQEIYTITNGSQSAVPGVGIGPYPTPGDTIRLEVSGTLLRAYLNGRMVMGGIDSTYTSGYPGLRVWAGGGAPSTEFENFTAGNLVVINGNWATSQGTVSLGSSRISVGGNINFSGGTITAGTSNVIMGTDGKSINGNGQTLYDFGIHGENVDATMTVTGTFDIDNALTVTSTDTLAINTSQTVTQQCTSCNALELFGTISGAGTLTYRTTYDFPDTGTVNVKTVFSGRSGAAQRTKARTFGGLVEVYSSSTTSVRILTLGTGGGQTLNFSSGLQINCSSCTTYSLTIDAATFDPTVNVAGNIDFIGSVGGTPIINAGTGWWTAGNNVDFTGGQYNTEAGNTLIMTASQDGTGTLTTAGNTLRNFTIDSAGVVTLAPTPEVHTVSGNLKLAGTGTPSVTNSEVVMNTTGTTFDGGGKTLWNFTFNVGGLGHTLTMINSNMTVANDLGITTGETIAINPNLTLTMTGNTGTTLLDDGSITGSSGKLVYQNTVTPLRTDNVITANVRLDAVYGNMTVPARTGATNFGSTLELYNNSGASRTFTLGSAGGQTISVASNLDLQSTGAASVIVVQGSTYNPTMNVTGNVLASNAAGTYTLNMGSSPWTVGGDFNLTNVGTFAHNSGTLNMNGAGKNLTSVGHHLNNVTISGGSVSLIDGSVVNVTDDFERTSLGGNWTARAGTPTIMNNSDFSGSTTGNNFAAYTAQSFSGNQFAEALLSTTPGSQEDIWVCVRMSSAGNLNAYCYGSDSTSSDLARIDNLGFTPLITGTPAAVAGDTIRLEVFGTRLRAYLNGTLVLTATDSTYASGYPGARAWKLASPPTNLQLESFRAGDQDTVLNGNLLISGGSLTASSALSVAGNWTNSGGSFVHNNGTVTLNGGAAKTLDSGCIDTTNCDNQDFYNLTIDKTDLNTANDNVSLSSTGINVKNILTITDGELLQGNLNVQVEGSTTAVSIGGSGKWTNTSTGDLKLGGALVNSGTAIFNSNNGTQCVNAADDIAITSTVGGAQRTWSGAGTFTIYNVNVTDQAGTVTAYTSTLNNTSWTVGLCNITISGVVRQSVDESTPFDCSGSNTLTIGVTVNGGASATADCTLNTGAFSITSANPPSATGDPVVVYIQDGETPIGTTATLTADATSDIANLDIIVNRLVLTHENAGPMTNAQLAMGDNGNPGLRYEVTNGTLITEPGIELHVKTGKTFLPSGNTSGLVSHWKFDEGSGTTAADSAGPNTGTLYQNAGWTTGQIGKAAYFDGSSSGDNGSRVEVADHNSLDITGDISLSAWIKLDALPPASGATAYPRIIQKGNNNSNTVYVLAIRSPVGEAKPTFGIKIAGTPDVDYSVESSTDVVAEQWYHFAGVRQGTTLKIYVNGVEMGNQTFPGGSIVTNTDLLTISDSLNNTDGVMKGAIDDARIYNRALTPNDVKALAATTLLSVGDVHLDDTSSLTVDTGLADINGDVTVDDGAILNSNADMLIRGGAITTNSTGMITTTGGTPTTTIRGTGTIGGGSGTVTFYNLTIGDGTTATSTLDSTTTVTNTLTVGSGSQLTINSGKTLSPTGAPNVNNDGTINGAGTLRFTNSSGGPDTNANSTGVYSSIVRFDATSADIPAATFDARTYNGTVELYSNKVTAANVNCADAMNYIISGATSHLYLLANNTGNLNLLCNTATDDPAFTIGGDLDYVGIGTGQESITTGNDIWTVGDNVNLYDNQGTPQIGLLTATAGHTLMMNTSADGSGILTAHNLTFQNFTTTGTGTVTLGVSGVGTFINGNLTLAASPHVFNANSAKITMDGPSNYIDGGGQTLNDLTIDPSSSGTITLQSSNLTVTGELHIHSDDHFVLSNGTTLTHAGSGFYMNWGNSASTISGVGTLRYTSSSGGPGTGGTLSSVVRYDATGNNIISGTVDARTYGGAVEFYSNINAPRSITLPSGNFTFLNNVTPITGNLQDAVLTVNASANPTINITGDLGYTKGGSATPAVVSGTETWTVGGQVNLTNGTYTANSDNTLVMNGTGTLTSAGNPLYNFTTSGTVGISDTTTVNNDLTISGGTLTAPAATLTVAGNWTNNSAFTHNNGTVTMTGTKSVTGNAATTFYNFNVPNNAQRITIPDTGSDVIVEHDLTYTLASSYLTIGAGRKVIYRGLAGGTLTTFNIDGSGMLVYKSPTQLPSILSLTATLRMDATDNDVRFSGNETISGPVEIYNAPGGGNTVFTGGQLNNQVRFNSTLIIAPADSGAIVFDARTKNNNVHVAGDFTIEANGTFLSPNGQDAYFSGNYTNNGLFTAGPGGKVEFNATSPKTLAGNLSGTSSFSNVRFNGVGGSWTATSTINLTSYMLIDHGTLTGTSDIYVAWGLLSSIGFDGVVNMTGGTFNVNGGGNCFGGYTPWTFNNLTFGGFGSSQDTLTCGTNTITVNGDLSVNGAANVYKTVSPYINFIVHGNVQGPGILNLTGSTFEQRVTTDKNFGSTTASRNWTFNNLIFSNSSGADRTITTQACSNCGVTVGGVLTVGQVGDAMATMLQAGSDTMTLSGSGTPLVIVGSSTLTPNTSTIRYTGSSATTITRTTYNHLEVKPGTNGVTHSAEGGGTLQINGNLTVGNGTNTGTFDLDANDPITDVNGSVTIAANATLNASGSGALAVGGNFTNNNVFAHNSGTLTMDGSGTLTSGNSTLNNLTCAGTISTSGTLTLDSNLLISSGTYTASATSLTVAGNWTNNSAFAHNNGTVNFSGVNKNLTGSSSTTFRNLTFSESTTIPTLGSDVTISNQFTVANGKQLTIDAGRSVSATGIPNVNNDGTITGAGTLRFTDTSGGPDTDANSTGVYSSIVRFDAAGNNVGSATVDARTYSGAVEFYSNSPARTIFLPSGTFTFLNNFTPITGTNPSAALLVSAILNPTINISGDLGYTNGGSSSPEIISGTGAWTVGGHVNLTNGVYTATSGNTIVMNGVGLLTAAGNMLQNFTITGGSVTSVGTTDINGAFAVTSGSFTQATNANLNVAGNFTLSTGVTFTKSGSGRLILDGDLTLTDSTSPKQNLGVVQVGTSPDTTNLASDLTATALEVMVGDVLFTNGFDLGIGTGGIMVAGTLDTTDDVETDETQVNTAGSFSLNNTASFVPDQSTLTFDGSSGTVDLITDGVFSLYNLTLNDAGGSLVVEVEDPLEVNNNLTITGGTLDTKVGEDNAITVGGNWSNGDTFLAQGGTVTLDGTGTLTPGSSSFHHLTSTGTITDVGATTLTGDFLLSSSSFTAPTAMTVAGNWTTLGTFVHGSGTVTLNGGTSTALNSNQDFSNLTIDKTDTDPANDNVTLASSLKVTNTLTIIDGEFIQGALNVQADGTTAVDVKAAGAWTNTSTGDIALGGSVANAGTITLQGNGPNCGQADDIAISSTAGQRAWTGIGTFIFNDLTVTNQGGTAAITAYSSTDDPSNGNNWTFSGCAGSVSVSGRIYTDDGVSPLNCATPRTVAVKINGVGTQTAACSNSPLNGSYTVPGLTVVSVGDVVSVYLAGETEQAVLVTTAADNYSNISGLNLYQDQLIVRHEDAGPITNAQLGWWDTDDDATNIFYTSNSTNLNLAAGKKLLVWSGKTYTPGGTVTTDTSGGDFHLDDNSSATLATNGNTIGRDILVDNGATLNLNADTTVDGGNIATIGTGVIASVGTPTVTMHGTGTIGGGSGTVTFYNLTIGDATAAATTISTDSTVTNTLTVDLGDSLSIAAGIVLSPTGSPNVNNDGTLNGTGTLQFTMTSGGPGSDVFSTGVYGSIVRFDATGGDILAPTVDARTYSGATEFYSNVTAPRSISLPSGSFSFNNNFTPITGAAQSSIFTVDASTNPTINITGDLGYTKGGSANPAIVSGTGTWTIGGHVNLTNGTYMVTPGNTQVMNGTGTLTSAGNILGNLTISGTGTVTLTGATHTLTGNLTITSLGVVATGSTIIMTGAGTTISGNGRQLGNMIIDPNPNGMVTVISSQLRLEGSLIVAASDILSISSGQSVWLDGQTLTLTGSIVGSGTLMYTNSATPFPTTGIFTANIRFWSVYGDMTIPNRTGANDFGGNVSFFNNSGSTRTFTLASAGQTISIAGDLDLQLTGSTSPITVTTNAGTVNVTGNVTTSNVAATNILNMGSGTWNVGGDFNLTNVGTFNHNSGTLVMDGTGILTSAGNTLQNFTASGSGTITLADATHTLAGNLTLGSTGLIVGTSTVLMTGTANISGFNTLNNLSIDGVNTIVTITGTTNIAVSGVLTIGGAADGDNDTFTIATDATITLNKTTGTSLTINNSGLDTISGPGTLTYMSTTVDFPAVGILANNLLVSFQTNGGAQNMTARTDWGSVIIFNSTSGNGSVTMLSGTQTLSGNLTVTVDGSGSVNLDAATNTPLVNLTGNFSCGGSGGGAKQFSTGNGTWTVGGNVNYTNCAPTINTGNTLAMNGVSKTLTSAGTPLRNLSVTGGSVTSVGATDVNGVFSVTGGTFTQAADANLNVMGNFTLGSGVTFTKATGIGRLILDGDLTLTDATNPKQDLGIVQIGTSPDTTNLASDLTATTLEVMAGDIMDTNGYDLDIGSGGIMVTGTLDTTDDMETDETQITTTGNFTVNPGGTFTADQSTLTLTGPVTATVSGTMTVYNLSVTVAGKTIQFQRQSSGSPVFTVAGVLTLTGINGNPIHLQSDLAGTQWLAHFNSAQSSVTYAAIKDSGCDTGTANVNLDPSSTNVGHNDVCWVFPVNPNAVSIAVNDGTGPDIDLTNVASSLSANWTATPPGVADHFAYALGTISGGSDIVGFTNNGTATTVSRTGLTLTDHAYYVTVQARNSSDLSIGQGISDGITVDTTPATLSNIYLTAGPTSITVSWNTSEVVTQYVAYGLTTAYGSQTSTTTVANDVHLVTLDNLTPGTMYHVRIYTFDLAGNMQSSNDLSIMTASFASVQPPSPKGIGGLPPGTIVPEVQSPTTPGTPNPPTLLRPVLRDDADPILIVTGVAHGNRRVNIYLDSTLRSTLRMGGSLTQVRDFYTTVSLKKVQPGKHRIGGQVVLNDGRKSEIRYPYTITVKDTAKSTATVRKYQLSRNFTYLVKRGDSLWAIARGFLTRGIRYPEIVKVNTWRYPSIGYLARLIYPGWGFLIPIK